MAVAGLAVNKNAVPKIVSDLKSIKSASPKRGEIKWANAKSYGGRTHKAYIDYLFELIAANTAHFHIRFSPMAQYNHEQSGPRKRIDTVSKSFYQLLLHRPIRHYGEHAHLHIYPDDGECTAMLPSLMGALATDEFLKFERAECCIQEISPRNSATEPMLQLLDVTLGALTAYRNNRHQLNHISATKRDLMQYALEKTGWPSIERNSRRDEIRLSKWNVVPQKRRGQRR